MAARVSSVRSRFLGLSEKIKGRAVLVGVAKGQPLSVVQEAVDAGLQNLGNNYAQEGEELKKHIVGVRWHFIGSIQSRKVKFLPGYDLVQSVDRLDILEALSKRLVLQKGTSEFLVELNLGGEDSKSGVAPSALESFVQTSSSFPALKCRGLMVLPPPLFPVEARRVYFKQAREILTRHAALGWDCLSMGTSEDYEVALEEGATIVRLGTVLFGPRP
jgi:PLP dependent protein